MTENKNKPNQANLLLTTLARSLKGKSVHKDEPETTVCFSVYLTPDGGESGPASVHVGRCEGSAVVVAGQDQGEAETA